MITINLPAVLLGIITALALSAAAVWLIVRRQARRLAWMIDTWDETD
jgi:hypothetical protein